MFYYKQGTWLPTRNPNANANAFIINRQVTTKQQLFGYCTKKKSKKMRKRKRRRK